jgi:hypothetical protein
VRPLKVIQEVIFPWSIGPSGAGYRYDIAVPDLKCLVEYDSTLHSKFNKHFHRTIQGFLESQARDEYKNRAAERNGWALFRVDEAVAGSELEVRRRLELRKLKFFGG